MYVTALQMHQSCQCHKLYALPASVLRLSDLDSRLSTFAQQNVESKHNDWTQVEQRTITGDYTAHRSATSATGYKMLEGVSGTPAGNSV